MNTITRRTNTKPKKAPTYLQLLYRQELQFSRMDLESGGALIYDKQGRLVNKMVRFPKWHTSRFRNWLVAITRMLIERH